MLSVQTAAGNWTHPSVVAMAQGGDAVDMIISRARHLAFSAIDSGWTGPPYDPFALAELLGICVVPRDDIRDARIVPLANAGLTTYQIEYNPNRSTQRVRFSLAHEIAHTLFPDCAQSIRNRAARHEIGGDEWQLEMLCNIAASELLMPASNFPTLVDDLPSIDQLMDLRQTFGVSTEAILLRYARTTRRACFVFAASRAENAQHSGQYRIDYLLSAASWNPGVQNGTELPSSTLIRQCTAVDYTAKGNEQWPGCVESIHIEAVGIPPYPAYSLPRVVGIGSPLSKQPSERDLLTFVNGDATVPRGDDENIIVHIVNDAASSWGGAFANAVRARWPHVAADYSEWANSDRRNLTLGACHIARASPKITVVSMIAQHGYGHSPKPRIRYAALEACLMNVASVAATFDPPATINMPRIGTGQAGGRWEIVQELVRDTVVRCGLSVFVYDLPRKGKAATTERSLFE